MAAISRYSATGEIVAMTTGDRVTGAGLVTVAIIEAVNETLKLEPQVAAKMPDFITASVWHFIPVILLTVIFIIWITKQIGARKSEDTERKRALCDVPHPPFIVHNESGFILPIGWAQLPKQVVGQHYENETVPLDGKHFHSCTFRNVVFNYEGTAGCGFDPDCKIGTPDAIDPVMLRSGNPIVQLTISLMRSLKMFKENTEHRTIDPKAR
jgi:hypothetical protein